MSGLTKTEKELMYQEALGEISSFMVGHSHDNESLETALERWPMEDLRHAEEALAHYADRPVVKARRKLVLVGRVAISMRAYFEDVQRSVRELLREKYEA